jgi:hypothetical protein
MKKIEMGYQMVSLAMHAYMEQLDPLVATRSAIS